MICFTYSIVKSGSTCTVTILPLMSITKIENIFKRSNFVWFGRTKICKIQKSLNFVQLFLLDDEDISIMFRNLCYSSLNIIAIYLHTISKYHNVFDLCFILNSSSVRWIDPMKALLFT